MGEKSEAIAEFAKAAQIDPGFSVAHNNLGNALLDAGRNNEAIGQYQKALQIRPGDGVAHINLGIALQKTGRANEAIAQYRDALQILPNQPEALHDLAWLLATSRPASLRDGNAALELAQRADALTGDSDPMVLQALAAAFAETGHFPEACATMQKAISFAREGSHPELVDRFGTELKCYETRTPWRE